MRASGWGFDQVVVFAVVGLDFFAGGRWDDADAIRDQLMEMKVTIQDTKDGSSWEIESS